MVTLRGLAVLDIDHVVVLDDVELPLVARRPGTRALAMLAGWKTTVSPRGNEHGEAERSYAEGVVTRNVAYRLRAGRWCQG